MKALPGFLALLLLGFSARADDSLIVRGRALFQDFNCAACHPGEHLAKASGASDLSQAAVRFREDWLFRWLMDPASLKSHRLMPAVTLTSQDGIDILAFLSSIAHPEKQVWSQGSAEQGAQLYAQVGCANCHKAQLELKDLSGKWHPQALAAYLLDPLAVDPSGRMPGSTLTTREAADLAAHLLKEIPAPDNAQQLGGDPNKGRSLVQSSGCVNCHTITVAGESLPSHLNAPLLTSESTLSGCLSPGGTGANFRFAFADTDRDAILAYLRARSSMSPAQIIAATQQRLRCQSCHELNGQPATGESTHGVPKLTDVEQKLRPHTLRAVLLEQSRSRPWLSSRMPEYGEAVAELLQHWKNPSSDSSPKASALRDINSGIALLGRGEGGLSCLSCHDFKGAKSGGDLRGPDLARVYQRLNPAWITRWLSDPSQVTPGTAMPNFFAAMSPAQAEEKIRAILAALSLGEDLPSLEGMNPGADAYTLRVKDEPILFRSFIVDASPQAIAVGLPGLVSYCFDAKEAKLLYAWSGDFLDVKKVWADRGGEAARPLGEKFFVAPSEFPLRLSLNLKPVIRFKGYRLREKLPTFMYEVDGVPVTETLLVEFESESLTRKFEIGAGSGPVRFLPGAGETISKQSPSAGDWIQIAERGPVAFSTSIPLPKTFNRAIKQ